MKLDARVKALESLALQPAQKPFGYDSYIRLSKALTYPCHPEMVQMTIGDAFNPQMTDNVPLPDHCLNREEYESLIWSSAEQCTAWVTDRCGLYDNTSVCVFMDNRVSGGSISREQQRKALASTFDGFDLSQIEVQDETLTTDFVVRVAETVNRWRTQRYHAEQAEREAVWRDWLVHRNGENPLHRDANERARQHRKEPSKDDNKN